MTLPLPKEELEKIAQELKGAISEFRVIENEIQKEELSLEEDLLRAAEEQKSQDILKKLHE